jgi:hypothetical protein
MSLEMADSGSSKRTTRTSSLEAKNNKIFRKWLTVLEVKFSSKMYMVCFIANEIVEPSDVSKTFKFL